MNMLESKDNFFPYEEIELPCLIEVLMTKGKAKKQEGKAESPEAKAEDKPLSAEEVPKVEIPSEELPKQE
jgi:hypothetical protein